MTTQPTLSRVPPHDLALERAVLGAVISESKVLGKIADVLRVEHFYTKQHQVIYEAALELFEGDSPIDLLTIANKLRAKKQIDEAGGPAYIAEISGIVASSAHIQSHIKIIHQLYIQRELIRVAQELQRDAFEGVVDPFELLARMSEESYTLAKGADRKEPQKVSAIAGRVVQQLEEDSQRTNEIIGVPSDFDALDGITAGFQNGELTIIGARPAMGKTAFALALAKNAAIKYKVPTAFFSLEMGADQLVKRLIGSEAGIASQRMRTPSLLSGEDFTKINHLTALFNANIFIDDSDSLSSLQLKSKSKKLITEKKIGLIIVDYLQLMEGEGGNKNREQQISAISRQLKLLAKNLGIPILALSQLSREVAKRGSNDNRPNLSDLRDSGAIEQNADNVLFLHRPEYYGKVTLDDGASSTGVTEVIVAKQRNGPTGVIKLHFDAPTNRFSSYVDPVYEYAPHYTDKF